MIDLDAPDPFSLAAWATNLIAEDPVKSIWFICAIASLVHGWEFLDLIEKSMRVKPMPRA
ncbi:MAG: hypothetical protein ABI467_21095 [Kofleriaceae bacterium]